MKRLFPVLIASLALFLSGCCCTGCPAGQDFEQSGSDSSSRKSSSKKSSKKKKKKSKNKKTSKKKKKKEKPKKVESIQISALDLYKEYDANEVAADDRLKGKFILIDGKVSKIRKDFLENIVIDLRGPRRFQNITLTMKPEAKSRASKLSKGESVTALCTGNGRIINTPQLKECVFK